jgi:two-component system, OmpR family, response regulator ResD
MITQAMSTSSDLPGPFVLVVDDEPTIGEIMARYLQRAGFRTGVALDGPQAIAMDATHSPDLVILDVMLPGFDGLEVMRRLHEKEHGRPAVILLTAKGEEADRITGLRRGADDYVAKPFSPGELVARVQAVLRRGDAEPTESPPLIIDGLQIDPAGRSVILDGRAVALTPREFNLLCFMASHAGMVFSRTELMEHVWESPAYDDSSTVTVHIRRLRAKIERDPENPDFIQTVWGVGYRFRR